jgi:hypothetical protein
MITIIHKDLIYAVKGTCFDVHNALGPMLPERFYQAALAIAPQRRGGRRESQESLRELCISAVRKRRTYAHQSTDPRDHRRSEVLLLDQQVVEAGLLKMMVGSQDVS